MIWKSHFSIFFQCILSTANGKVQCNSRCGRLTFCGLGWLSPSHLLTASSLQMRPTAGQQSKATSWRFKFFAPKGCNRESNVQILSWHQSHETFDSKHHGLCEAFSFNAHQLWTKLRHAHFPDALNVRQEKTASMRCCWPCVQLATWKMGNPNGSQLRATAAAFCPSLSVDFRIHTSC